jgi:hypothetical protein
MSRSCVKSLIWHSHGNMDCGQDLLVSCERIRLSNETVASIFTSEEDFLDVGFELLIEVVMKSPIFCDRTPHPLRPAVTPVSCLAYSSILTIEQTCTSETKLTFKQLHGTRQRSWLRHHATSRKVTGSIPDKVIGFFSLCYPSSHTMALGST